MIVYVAGNGSRYHKVPGCCNAMLPMELKDAIEHGREASPICYDEFMIEYANTIARYNVAVQSIEQEESEQANNDITPKAE